MSYIGNTPEQQAFTPQVDYFNGNNSTTSFTLSRNVASVAQVEAVIENVVQNPTDAYTVNGNTITFTSAPPSGTNNIYVRYTSPITTVMVPTASSVNTNELANRSVTPAKMVNSGYEYGMRNRIINGDMRIDQRNAGNSVSFAAGANGYSLDRWYIDNATDGVFTIEQVEDAPAGFYQSLKLTVTTADASIGATQDSVIGQRIEGLNINDLNFGTASASTVTLSFWVKSSLTGVFGGSLMNSAYTRAYPFSFTINSANTWEQKVVTIAGDTTGTWLNTSSVGIRVSFSMAAGASYSGTANAWASALLLQPTGSTNVIGTNGATFYITGVQLEKGTQATPFEYRHYTTELQLCQRYFQTSYAEGTPVGTITSTYAVGRYIDAPGNYCGVPYSFPVRMRLVPSVFIYGVFPGATSGQVSGDTANKTGAVFQSGFWGFNAGCNNVASTTAESVRFHFTAASEL